MIRDGEEFARIEGISLDKTGSENNTLPLELSTTDETVALLPKLSEAKHHIEVKVDMDELDLTSAIMPDTAMSS